MLQLSKAAVKFYQRIFSDPHFLGGIITKAGIIPGLTNERIITIERFQKTKVQNTFNNSMGEFNKNKKWESLFFHLI